MQNLKPVGLLKLHCAMIKYQITSFNGSKNAWIKPQLKEHSKKDNHTLCYLNFRMSQCKRWGLLEPELRFELGIKLRLELGFDLGFEFIFEFGCELGLGFGLKSWKSKVPLKGKYRMSNQVSTEFYVVHEITHGKPLLSLKSCQSLNVITT